MFPIVTSVDTQEMSEEHTNSTISNKKFGLEFNKVKKLKELRETQTAYIGIIQWNHTN
jgi:hypothetical protein